LTFTVIPGNGKTLQGIFVDVKPTWILSILLKPTGWATWR